MTIGRYITFSAEEIETIKAAAKEMVEQGTTDFEKLKGDKKEEYNALLIGIDLAYEFLKQNPDSSINWDTVVHREGQMSWEINNEGR